MPPLPGSWSLSGFLYFGRGQWLIRFFARPPDTHSRAKVTLKPNEQVCHLGVIGDPENVINRDQTRDELKYICFQNEVLTTNEYRRHCLFTIDFSHILPTFEPYVFLLQRILPGKKCSAFGGCVQACPRSKARSQRNLRSARSEPCFVCGLC